MTEGTTPGEICALAGKLIALADENMSCSAEVLAAAFKCAAAIVDETRTAEFAAIAKASILSQYRPKR